MLYSISFACCTCYVKLLTRSSADSVDHLIENGQPVDGISHLIENGKLLDAIKLARLTDKYPPLSLMNEYVEKAKKTAQEILSREGDSPDSLVCPSYIFLNKNILCCMRAICQN